MVRGVARGLNINVAGMTPKPKPKPSTVEELRRLFWRYDADGDGKLSRKELKDAFDYLDSLVPGWRAYRALHYADENGDGYISGGEIDKLVNYAVKLGFLERQY